MKVLCVDDTTVNDYITKGKYYDVEAIPDRENIIWFKVSVCDDGGEFWGLPKNFEIVDEKLKKKYLSPCSEPE